MGKTSKAIFWIIIFFCCLLAVDQFMIRVEFKKGGMQVTQEFYLDFRQRLFGLTPGSGAKSVEEVIAEKQQPAAPMAKPDNAPRYVYADDSGVLQFADSMEDIPPQYRESAERMEE
ncbi:MAG: hypothetical protein C0615_10000 [Desulfuromonas sp.]|nr:MAG: hypothetical protein C0615_10000 [Desulfuromonas sp.]